MIQYNNKKYIAVENDGPTPRGGNKNIYSGKTIKFQCPECGDLFEISTSDYNGISPICESGLNAWGALIHNPIKMEKIEE